jgi:hypothetical protein
MPVSEPLRIAEEVGSLRSAGESMIVADALPLAFDAVGGGAVLCWAPHDHATCC